MRAFRTILKPHVSQHTLNLKDRILTIGSCFADAVGSRLISNKVAALQNPFGVVYNPISLHKLLTYSIAGQEPDDSTYLMNNDIHLNYDFHSELSATSKDNLKKSIREKITATRSFLTHSSRVIITYGTGWVYKRKDNDETVANCHKIPQGHFKKELLTQKRILESFDSLYKLLLSHHPDVRIILTVSPVRHIKDTLELNSVSKSLLRVVCHTLANTYPNIEYFPAYEIMMDDLRDYRFYKPDMMHATEEAEDYIWENFVRTYFDEQTQMFFDQWKKIRQSLAHRPFHVTSPSHQRFLESLLNDLEELKSFVNVEKEMEIVRSQLFKHKP